MSEDSFNMSIRKFLKQVGISSQREIEALVRNGQVAAKTIHVRMVLTADGTNLHHEIEGEIELP
jgi:16S rRNA U516 pseudouridylate synthase RsuA-like enzyme